MDDALDLKGLKFKCTNQDHYYGRRLTIGKVYKAEGSRKMGDGWNNYEDRICLDGYWYGLLNFEPVDYTVNRKGEKFYVGDVTIFDGGYNVTERTIAKIGDDGHWADTTDPRIQWIPDNLVFVRRGTVAVEDGDAWTIP